MFLIFFRFFLLGEKVKENPTLTWSQVFMHIIHVFKNLLDTRWFSTKSCQKLFIIPPAFSYPPVSFPNISLKCIKDSDLCKVLTRDLNSYVFHRKRPPFTTTTPRFRKFCQRGRRIMLFKTMSTTRSYVFVHLNARVKVNVRKHFPALRRRHNNKLFFRSYMCVAITAPCHATPRFLQKKAEQQVD